LAKDFPGQAGLTELENGGPFLIMVLAASGSYFAVPEAMNNALL
jgi:hypothetical protein